MNITKFLNKVYFAPRLKEIEQYTSHAGELQQLVLQRLVRTAANTEWGKKHDYASIRTYEDFKKRLPIQTYEEVKPYVTRLRAGEQNLLWPRNTLVCQIIGYHQRQEQVPARQPGVLARHALQGRPGCRCHLSGTESRKPFLFR